LEKYDTIVEKQLCSMSNNRSDSEKLIFSLLSDRDSYEPMELGTRHLLQGPLNSFHGQFEYGDSLKL
jgi:hypothetical protein